MYTTIDFDKYKVSQDSLEGTEKTAAGIGSKLMDSAISAVTAKGAGKLMDKVDDAFLRPTTGKGAVSTAERNAARQQLALGAGALAAYQGGKALYQNKKAVKDMALRAIGKNPNKNRDRALAAAGVLGAGGLAYTGARYNQLRKEQENFDRQYGYGDYYGRGKRSNPYEKYASVEEAYAAGYEAALGEFEKVAGPMDWARNLYSAGKQFVVNQANHANKFMDFVSKHPRTVFKNIQRSRNPIQKAAPGVNPMQAWGSMSNNAKWMTGAGIAGLGAAAYHQGAMNQRKVEIR